MIAIIALVGTAWAPASSREPEPYDVYVLAGQSNMSGRGALADLTAAERIADPRILLYGNDAHWHEALDPLDDAANQVDQVSSDRQAAVGPGLAFARAILRAHKRMVALVPCAKGGSSIAAWAPSAERSTLYGSCVKRTREAGGHLAGMLWYQGESDAQKVTAGEWRDRFATLVADFRRDFKAPRLPIVFVQIAKQPAIATERYPSWPIVQDQQARVSLACVAMVSANALDRNPDDLHLTTGAQRILGIKLATAMAELSRKGCR